MGWCGGNMGTLVTLRDMESAAQLGHELEVSRRLAAIGRLTAGVGHEVKNPINAMVVHLELLRGKLVRGMGGVQRGATACGYSGGRDAAAGPGGADAGGLFAADGAASAGA